MGLTLLLGKGQLLTKQWMNVLRWLSHVMCVCMLVNDTMILQDGQRLGIGSGSTIVFAVDRIGQCIKCKHALSCDSHVRTCIVM